MSFGELMEDALLVSITYHFKNNDGSTSMIKVSDTDIKRSRNQMKEDSVVGPLLSDEVRNALVDEIIKDELGGKGKKKRKSKFGKLLEKKIPIAELREGSSKKKKKKKKKKKFAKFIEDYLYRKR